MKEPRIRTELIEIFMRTEPITKEELCKKCRITIKSFDKIMRNDFSVRISNIYKLARFMHLYLNQMFD